MPARRSGSNTSARGSRPTAAMTGPPSSSEQGPSAQGGRRGRQADLAHGARTVIGISAHLVAACGSKAEAGSASTSPAATTKTTEPPMRASQPRQMRRRWASSPASSRHEGEWRVTVADDDDTCTDPAAVAICATTYSTASLEAESLRRSVRLASPRVPGQPAMEPVPRRGPRRHRALVTDTEVAAAEYRRVSGMERDRLRRSARLRVRRRGAVCDGLRAGRSHRAV